MPVPSGLVSPPGLPIADAAIRATSNSRGAVPRGGFNALVPELDVSDLAVSLRFWCDLLGFEIAYKTGRKPASPTWARRPQSRSCCANATATGRSANSHSHLGAT